MVEVLVEGEAVGPLLVLSEPLSFWGGVEVSSGEIIDAAHPEAGRSVSGVILVLPHGRGSSSSATVLAETIRNGCGPVGILLDEVDEILVTGAFVANSLYGTTVPVVVADTPESREGVFSLDSSGCRQVGID